jgi:uncharacterized protein (TIGR02391 family)
MSGVQLDGAALVDRVFNIDRPILAINSLRTETEKSEHKGFAALLKGCFAAVRNPLAHEPKISGTARMTPLITCRSFRYCIASWTRLFQPERHSHEL